MSIVTQDAVARTTPTPKLCWAVGIPSGQQCERPADLIVGAVFSCGCVYPKGLICEQCYKERLRLVASNGSNVLRMCLQCCQQATEVWSEPVRLRGSDV